MAFEVFEEMHRRQQDIAAARRRKKKKKFSLLLSHISVPASSSQYGSKRNNNTKSRMKYFFLVLAPFIVVLLFIFSKRSAQPPPDRASVRNKYWKANVVEYKPNSDNSNDEDDEDVTTTAAATTTKVRTSNSASTNKDINNDSNSASNKDTDHLFAKLADNARPAAAAAKSVKTTNKDSDNNVSNSDNTDNLLAKLAGSARPFNYIGDYDPTLPKPWPEEEKDWWALHNTLVKRVRDSDATPPLEFDINQSRLPQLIFYGDSITEGWGGTTFGALPRKHRMWKWGEDKKIRTVFGENFGSESVWGKRALKDPLVLGISGSRTYDFLWRIENGEFPTSKLLDHHEEDNNGEDNDNNDDNEEQLEEKDMGDDASSSSKPQHFQLDKLERIYIVLMGTNNLGGGMLPAPTLEGMDATGRAILTLHAQKFPNQPAAMLFSELLPRRDDFRAVKMCPPRCKNMTSLEPYDSFMPAIEKVNRGLPEILEGWRRDFGNSRVVLLSRSEGESKQQEKPHDRLGLVNRDDDDDEEGKSSDSNDYTMTINCGREMFAIDDDEEFDKFMPDRLHPNAKGYELWANCLKKGLEVVMDHAISLTET